MGSASEGRGAHAAHRNFTTSNFTVSDGDGRAHGAPDVPPRRRAGHHVQRADDHGHDGSRPDQDATTAQDHINEDDTDDIENNSQKATP